MTIMRVNITVTSSIAGIMIPPSQQYDLYVFMLSPLGALCLSLVLVMAGVVPGILMCVIFARRGRSLDCLHSKNFPDEEFAGFKVIFFGLLAHFPVWFTGVIVLSVVRYRAYLR